jgi:MYXO-CTERM domain-containing protein
MDAQGNEFGVVTGVSGTVTSISGSLENNKKYKWSARAVDRAGAMSDWSRENTFTVTAPIDDPEVVVNGGGCQSSSAPGTGSLLALGLGLIGAFGRLVRRRRR